MDQKIQRAGSYAIKLGLELRADVVALHVVPAGKHFPEENLEKGIIRPTIITSLYHVLFLNTPYDLNVEV